MTTFWLCREFGWTPRQVREQSARDVEALCLVLDEWRAVQGQHDTGASGATTIVVTDD